MNSLTNSEDNEDVPKASDAAEFTQPQHQQEVIIKSYSKVPEAYFDGAPIPTGEDSQPPPLPPRLPAAQCSNLSRNALLDADDIVSGKKQNLKPGQSDNRQHKNNGLLLGANLNPPQLNHCPRLKNRDNRYLQEVKREPEELQWDVDTTSFRRSKSREAELGDPPSIVSSPTPCWGSRGSSPWNRSQCASRLGAADSAELLPPGLFSSPRTGNSCSFKKETLKKERGENVETLVKKPQVAKISLAVQSSNTVRWR